MMVSWMSWDCNFVTAAASAELLLGIRPWVSMSSFDPGNNPRR